LNVGRIHGVFEGAKYLVYQDGVSFEHAKHIATILVTKVNLRDSNTKVLERSKHWIHLDQNCRAVMIEDKDQSKYVKLNLPLQFQNSTKLPYFIVSNSTKLLFKLTKLSLFSERGQ